MLMIVVPDIESFNNETQEFIYVKGCTFRIEHSLISISKWESKWRKPFLSTADKTNEEIIDYIRCMTITQNVRDEVYNYIPAREIQRISDYINAPMTATWFSEDKQKKPAREIITSEVIYYWMIAYNIPVEFQKWHLNRLITLIRVCSAKNQPSKKMSSKDILARNKALNDERLKKFNTTG